MMKYILCTAAMALSTAGLAQMPPPQTNAPSGPKTTSIQEMLVIGHSSMKLHSLAMITQGKVPGGVDESFLPGFKICAEDPATPVRSITARVMGQSLIAGQDVPNQDAVELLIKLAQDESADVRYSAVYYGLSEIKNKSDEIVELLVDIAASNREQGLHEQIVQSLKESTGQVVEILDRKLDHENSIAFFEIYEGLTGQEPPKADTYLEMPSSRPKMFIFKGDGGDTEAYKSKLESELEAAGMESPEIFISGVGANYVLLLKTYLTRDRLMVEKRFVSHDTYSITQSMWLTPELEIQIEFMRNLK